MKKNTLKVISIEQYNSEMNKIIAKHLPVNETLILLLETASKYKIKEKKWPH